MPLRRIKIEDLEEVPEIRQRTPLPEAFPEIAAMWLKAKNRGFRAEQFSVGSNIEVWFKCPEGTEHVFQKAISSMVLARRKGAKGCPACKGDLVTKENSLAKRFPKIAKEYSEKKNALELAKISYGSSRRVWWHCSKCDHEWQTAISNRTQLGSSCPNCRKSPLLDLTKLKRYIRFFDKKANKGIDPAKLPTRKPVWWKCNRGPDHQWKQFFKEKDGDFCPFCRGAKPSLTNNLTLMPALVKEYHPTKNKKLKPKDVSMRSFRSAWWKCPKGSDHEWEGRVYERTFEGAGCPFCRNHRLSITNSLAKLCPDVAKEWHPTKNGKLKAKDVVAFTTREAWFLCPNGHSYEKPVHLRVRFGLGCPDCKKAGIKRTKTKTLGTPPPSQHKETKATKGKKK
ncbi:hypothetical protein BH11CYA1_BH11CYA1_43440 [soil metagenome]